MTLLLTRCHLTVLCLPPTLSSKRSFGKPDTAWSNRLKSMPVSVRVASSGRQLAVY